MRIYQLTPIGRKMARSTNNPDTNAWRIIHHLDRVGEATAERIALATGMSEGEASTTLSRMARVKPQIVRLVGS